MVYVVLRPGSRLGTDKPIIHPRSLLGLSQKRKYLSKVKRYPSNSEDKVEESPSSYGSYKANAAKNNRTHHSLVDRTNMRHTKQSCPIRVLLPDITLLKHYSINTQRKLSYEKVNTTSHYTKWRNVLAHFTNPFNWILYQTLPLFCWIVDSSF